MGKNVTLKCEANGFGSLEFSWERQDAGNWIVITTRSTTTYTAKTSGLYRCRVSNEAGSVVSNNATVKVYGKYYPNQ